MSEWKIINGLNKVVKDLKKHDFWLFHKDEKEKKWFRV